ncbi:BON domain-containing protein [Massilia eurypsychrophila]|jgi:hyperosmotically inducible protein|uniref:BON domain-containing protein n=1 Tax=Massilia eurypsychrophila TaxID=1485217 RepID=UPI001E331545|nr:BON domain-containing protein [Massilia eurypsychrophila]
MKTTILATLLATAVSASFAAAPTANQDTATYRNVTAKAAADYKAAAAQCTSMTGSAKSICTEEAKAARARADADAVAQYNNTAKGRVKARTMLAHADYGLAKAKCADMTGADKSACLSTAASAHTAALADAKADRAVASTDGANPVTTTATRDANKAAAVDKCAQIAGGSKTGCLIDNKTGEVTTLGGAGTTAATTAPGTVANRTANAVDNAADKTRSAAAVAAEKTRNAASTAVEKTKEVAANVADKTRNAAAAVANKTDRATDNVADSSTVRKGSAVVADSVITTKVKADIFKEPELKSMAIHVETEKGVVMLSGFVDSKADADKAVALAKSVEGVSNVKSAIKVK